MLLLLWAIMPATTEWICIFERDAGHSRAHDEAATSSNAFAVEGRVLWTCELHDLASTHLLLKPSTSFAHEHRAGLNIFFWPNTQK